MTRTHFIETSFLRKNDLVFPTMEPAFYDLIYYSDITFTCELILLFLIQKTVLVHWIFFSGNTLTNSMRSL